jgi:alkylhydroperoxidase/carboxymuconolactone decarboxylase family protein YurZ
MAEIATQQRLKEMNARFSNLAKAAPQAVGAFRALMMEASKDGAMPAKFKELIAVAIAVHQGCSDCILLTLAAEIG